MWGFRAAPCYGAPRLGWLAGVSPLRRRRRSCRRTSTTARASAPGPAHFRRSSSVVARRTTTWSPRVGRVDAGDARTRALADGRIRHRHDGDLPDLRVCVQEILDFLHAELLAGANDDVLHVARDGETPVRVQAPEVPGPEESARIERVRGERRVPIAEKTLRAARSDLSLIAGSRRSPAAISELDTFGEMGRPLVSARFGSGTSGPAGHEHSSRWSLSKEVGRGLDAARPARSGEATRRRVGGAAAAQLFPNHDESTVRDSPRGA
jgi:hypothetical protein